MIDIPIQHKVNQFQAFLALTKASFLSSLRNPTSLFFNFFFPFVFITIFGLLSNGSTSYDVAIRPGSLQQGPVYEALQKVSALHLITNESDETIQSDLNKGQLPIAITITENTPVATAAGKVQTYSLLIERSTAAGATAQAAESIINAVVQNVNTAAARPAFTLVTPREQVVEGRKYQQIDFILPGQLAFALIMNAIFGIAFVFMTYKRDLILKRYFAAPVNKSSIMGAEMVGKIIIAIIQALIIIGVGHFVFNFTLANGIETVINMVILSIVGIVVFLSLGLLVVTLSKREESVTPLSQLIMMPQLFLSGAFFPIDAFPAVVQPIARIMPMTFLNDAFKKIAFEGAPLTAVLPQIGSLLIWAVVIYIIVLITFKWE